MNCHFKCLEFSRRDETRRDAWLWTHSHSIFGIIDYKTNKKVQFPLFFSNKGYIKSISSKTLDSVPKERTHTH